MAPGKEIEMLGSEDIEKIVEKINSDKDAEANQRRGGARGGASGSGNGNGGAAPSAQGAEQVLASRPAGEGSAGPTE